jgi:hypothetical protein
MWSGKNIGPHFICTRNVSYSMLPAEANVLEPDPIILMNDLSFVTSYWCSDIAPEIDNQFEWASEALDEELSKIKNTNRDLLLMLVKTAPSKHSLASFAAVPLENYINLIVKKGNKGEALRIAEYSELSNLFKYVWGQIDQFNKMILSAKPVPYNDKLVIEHELEQLKIKDVTCFWSQLAASPQVNGFRLGYQRILDALEDPETRREAANDLLASAPNEKLSSFVNDMYLFHYLSDAEE